MSNFELQEKAVKAAARFIERKGYELLETGWTSPEGTKIELIANDEDTLVFIDVTATEYGEGGFEGGKVSRSDLEIAAASWLAVSSPDGEIQVRQAGGQVCRLHRLDGDIVRIFNDVLFGCLQAHALLQRKDAQVLQQEQGAAAVGGVRRDADLIAGAAGAGRQAQRQYQRQYQCQKFFHNKLPSLNCFSNISQTAANGVFAEAGGALFSACACPLCGRQDQK